MNVVLKKKRDVKPAVSTRLARAETLAISHDWNSYVGRYRVLNLGNASNSRESNALHWATKPQKQWEPHMICSHHCARIGRWWCKLIKNVLAALVPHKICSIGIIYSQHQRWVYASTSHLAKSFSKSNLGSSGSVITVWQVFSTGVLPIY